ncbi:adiponectin receptor protein 1-like isoform X2 [Acanthaster planci]|uniref:Adiponectin receptor protein 1-like isoform X2 n=1 Tax=Acanthaster planci TaxID=133434 RepID=A0A8B7ZMS1_ACAPL|nr:adiponectin receptor protein 1-like isoform X2 [Acanthaster planci]
MNRSNRNGSYWLRKRAVGNSKPVSRVATSTTTRPVTRSAKAKAKTMLSHVPLATEEECVVSVPDEESSDSSDESDCEKSLNPEETAAIPTELEIDVVSSDEPAEIEEVVPQENADAQEQQKQHVEEETDIDSGGPSFSHTAAEQAERFVRKVKEAAWRWRVTHHHLLPDWLKDNDFLHFGHRPQIPSFKSCFGSIFRIHTETGNIWTHLIGFIAFVILMIYFLVASINDQEKWEKIVVYMAFFTGAVLCLFFSWVFHTVYCHSSKTSLLFSKLDYSGISLLIVGSFIPWLYFGFYCQSTLRYVYISLIVILGLVCMIVALRDQFSTRKFRALRAGLFLGLGLSAIIPACHFLAISGFVEAFQNCAFGWILLMAGLYITGAIFYAVRIPERFFPGKCDIWFHSHQFFHVLVVAAAFVHYHGLNLISSYRESLGPCASDILDEEVQTNVFTGDDLYVTVPNV